MKIVGAKKSEDLEIEIKERFAEFNKASSGSKRRRYPDELKDLLRQAHKRGVRIAALCRLAEVSRPVVKDWLAARGASTPVSTRRLAVVKSAEGHVRVADPAIPVVVRLPSGVTIELADCRALSSDLLTVLCGVEVAHAASR